MLINFYGTPLPTQYGRRAKILALCSKGDITISGLLATFAMAADSMLIRLTTTHPSFIFTSEKVLENVGIYVSSCVLGLIASRYLDKKALQNFLSEEILKEKAINTTPDLTKPYDHSMWREAAVELKGIYRGNLVSYLSIVAPSACAVLIGLFSHTTVSDAVYSATAALRIMTILLPFPISKYLSLQRWKKVETGEWHITDRGPPPEPVRHPLRSTPRFEPVKIRR